VSLAGEINGWRCDRCGQHTYCIHVNDGVTPMFLACRASGRLGDCDGTGASLMYPGGPPPAHVIEAVQFEWYEPTGFEYRRLEPSAREHVDKGGLLLRDLTDAGRRLLSLSSEGTER